MNPVTHVETDHHFPSMIGTDLYFPDFNHPVHYFFPSEINDHFLKFLLLIISRK